VDDGSAEAFRVQDEDDRVRCIRRDRQVGVCAARNVGLEAARGRWITFLDDDDELSPQMLARSLNAAATSSLPRPVAVLSGIQIVDGNGAANETLMPATLPRGRHYFLEEADGFSFQVHNTLVAPVDVVRQIGGWDQGIRAAEHDDFFLRLNATCSIEGIQEVTYRKAAHAAPRLSRDLVARAEGWERTIEKHRDILVLHRRKYADLQDKVGITYLRAGRWRPAMAYTSRSLLEHPWRPEALLWWAASLAGPRGLECYRWVRDRLTSRRPT
jgi:glycosyltransferase involved in cell wall biosynthesis